MALFEIRHLTFAWPGCDTPALKDLDFAVEEGEFLVVCGKSGCGKSTLLRHFKTAMSPYGKRDGKFCLTAGYWRRYRYGNRVPALVMCCRARTTRL